MSLGTSIERLEELLLRSDEDQENLELELNKVMNSVFSIGESALSGPVSSDTANNKSLMSESAEFGSWISARQQSSTLSDLEDLIALSDPAKTRHEVSSRVESVQQSVEYLSAKKSGMVTEITSVEGNLAIAYEMCTTLEPAMKADQAQLKQMQKR